MLPAVWCAAKTSKLARRARRVPDFALCGFARARSGRVSTKRATVPTAPRCPFETSRARPTSGTPSRSIANVQQGRVRRACTRRFPIPRHKGTRKGSPVKADGRGPSAPAGSTRRETKRSGATSSPTSPPTPPQTSRLGAAASLPRLGHVHGISTWQPRRRRDRSADRRRKDARVQPPPGQRTSGGDASGGLRGGSPAPRGGAFATRQTRGNFGQFRNSRPLSFEGSTNAAPR